MALFDAVKISELPPSELVFKDDLMVVDRLQASQSYVTNAVRIGKLVDYITTLDLNFTGNITINGTIQPLPGNDLDAIFDNLTIRQSITIEEGAEINGLYLDDLEDVTIEDPVVGDIIMYVNDPVTRDSKFVNVPGITEAPKDGKIYARSNGVWIDITDCLRCPSDEIGDVVIIKVDDLPLGIGTVHTYRATAPTLDSSITDLTYSWTANSDQVTYTNASEQSTNVTFAEAGVYILTCEVSSETASDSPQFGRKTVTIQIPEPPETCRLVTDPYGAEANYLLTESSDFIQYEPNVCSDNSNPDYEYYTLAGRSIWCWIY